VADIGFRHSASERLSANASRPAAPSSIRDASNLARLAGFPSAGRSDFLVVCISFSIELIACLPFFDSLDFDSRTSGFGSPVPQSGSLSLTDRPPGLAQTRISEDRLHGRRLYCLSSRSKGAADLACVENRLAVGRATTSKSVSKNNLMPRCRFYFLATACKHLPYSSSKWPAYSSGLAAAAVP